jgi:hypothetical protein
MSKDASAELLACVRKYRIFDDKLKVLNKATHALREDRKVVELEMSDILKIPAYATISKLEISDSTVIKIQRPDLWSKPWSLSAKDMKGYLEDYFKRPGVHTAEDCHAFIVDRRKGSLISTEFSFSRMSQNEKE